MTASFMWNVKQYHKERYQPRGRRNFFAKPAVSFIAYLIHYTAPCLTLFLPGRVPVLISG
jgi:hypothetical protein